MGKAIQDTTPVIVGVSRYTRKTPKSVDLKDIDVLLQLSPLKLHEEAIRRAIADTKTNDAASLISQLDEVVCIKSFLDMRTLAIAQADELYKNMPQNVADLVGACNAKTYETVDGGNMPQSCVNNIAEKIANGEIDSALVASAEALATYDRAMKSKQYYLKGSPSAEKDKAKGLQLFPWGTQHDIPQEADSHAHVIGSLASNAITMRNLKQGLGAPRKVYPLFEESLRHAEGEKQEEHLKKIGNLFHEFTKVAAAPENAKHSWFPIERSPAELITATPTNRLITTPYTKYLNSLDQVDMSAAILVMSVRKAKQYNIPESQWVFLHGCADTEEVVDPLERPVLHRSPAIQMGGFEALRMSGKTVADMKHLDVYSCFPVAVQVACREIGIQYLPEPRVPLTVTGGLPYHGGPGNSYVTHSIAAMCERLRRDEFRGDFGLVTANGGNLTKHSFGVYSTEPVRGRWSRRHPMEYQKLLNEVDKAEIARNPNGPCVIESYTVSVERQPARVIIVGRMLSGTESGCRFVANTKVGDTQVVKWFLSGDRIGAFGTVTNIKPDRYMFVPDEFEGSTNSKL